MIMAAHAPAIAALKPWPLIRSKAGRRLSERRLYGTAQRIRPARPQPRIRVLPAARLQPALRRPRPAGAYRRLASDLQQALEGDTGEDLRAELHQLIDSVDFIPLERLGKFQLEVHGSLAAQQALGGAADDKKPRGEWQRGF